MRPIRTLGGVLAIAALVAVGARADENDRLTYLTFSGPVQLPGVTLAAGTYTFKLADLSGSKHVVHVMTKEDSPKLITTLMTIPNERLDPVGHHIMPKRPAGMPQAMKGVVLSGPLDRRGAHLSKAAGHRNRTGEPRRIFERGRQRWAASARRQLRTGFDVDQSTIRRRRRRPRIQHRPRQPLRRLRVRRPRVDNH